jgi:DNA polymerase-3 subunit epsilon
MTQKTDCGFKAHCASVQMMKELKRLCFVDLETTGGRATHDRIIEIGIIVVENNKVVSEYSQLINPECVIPKFIEDFTGIKNADVQSAPTFAQVADVVADFLKDGLFIAHNVRFDHAFLKNEFRRIGRGFTVKQMCTVKLSRKLYPQYRKHNLDSIIERFDLDFENRHRALDDAKLIYEFWRLTEREHMPEVLKKAYKNLLKKPSVPLHLQEQVFDELPETPGVYIFYGKSTEIPLYIGKSTNIRSRVMSHFSGDHLTSRELQIAQQVFSIDTIQTPGELGALLLESRMIKERMPIYNRQLRKRSELVTLMLRSTADGFNQVEIVRSMPEEAASEKNTYGVFRSKKDAEQVLQEIADADGLCHKYLGLEKTKDTCFAWQLKKCSGACAGEVSASEHNMRLEIALARLRLSVWPFANTIGIREINEENESTEIHLVQNWCVLGTITSEDELGDFISQRPVAAFDLDTYKILRRYFKGKKKPDIVHLPQIDATREQLELLLE